MQPDQQALMGQVSRAMVERYSHVRMDAMRKAVETLSLEKSRVTSQDSIQPSKDSAKVSGSATVQQVGKSCVFMVGARGLEPQTSCV
jgi:hypothetical protein